MCGIAGILFGRHDGGGGADTRLVRRMTDALAHRGPDGSGHHSEDGVRLGHRRLAVVDVDGGRQPMFNESGDVAVVFNGEVYNFAALRRDLIRLGHRFASRSDTEVLVHGWEEWGTALVERIEGMFAFAVWDRRSQSLFLARDRLGKKPLYYSWVSGSVLAFASEIGALRVVPGASSSIDARAVDDFMALSYVPDQSCILSGVAKLGAGCFLLQRRGAPQAVQSRYWTPAWRDMRGTRLDEAVDLLNSLLSASVSARLMSDVPLGAFLSGGVDSGLVCAVAASLSDGPLSAFTVAFPGGGDESGPARAVARAIGASHHVAASVPDYVDAARHQSALFGEPFGDSSAVPALEVAAMARRSVTVALTGDGGDEVFGGYRRHRFHLLAEGVRSMVPAGARAAVFGRLAAAYPRLSSGPRWLRARTTLTELGLDSAVGYYSTVCKAHEEERRGVLSKAALAEVGGHDPGRIVAEAMSVSDDPLRQAQLADIATYLPGDILAKVDRTGMAASLEARCPFLDHRVVEFGLSLPRALKVRGGTGKVVLRELARRLLPDGISTAPKRGFAVPLADTLRSRSDMVRARLLSPAMLDSGLYDRRGLASALDAHCTGRDRTALLWNLLVMEGFLAGVARPASEPAVPVGSLGGSASRV